MQRMSREQCEEDMHGEVVHVDADAREILRKYKGGNKPQRS